jgi:hypothetical protein
MDVTFCIARWAGSVSTPLRASCMADMPGRREVSCDTPSQVLRHHTDIRQTVWSNASNGVHFLPAHRGLPPPEPSWKSRGERQGNDGAVELVGEKAASRQPGGVYGR